MIPWLERGVSEVEITKSEANLPRPNSVRLHYQRIDSAQNKPTELWITCQFGGGYFQQNRLALTSIESSRDGILPDIEIAMLTVILPYLSNDHGVAVAHLSGDSLPQFNTATLYFLQQTLNALVLGALYGLLAIGYTLIYAIIGRINLVFGEFAMVGSYITLITVALLVSSFQHLPLIIIIGVPLLCAMAVGMLYGVIAERLVFRPLHHTRTHAPLIASIGLAIALQEFVRLSQGARDFSLQPVFTERLILASNNQFDVSVTAAQLLIVMVCLILFGTLLIVIRNTKTGLGFRACSEDPLMAALCGVNVPRTIAICFAAAGAIAALGGYISTLYYGSVTFYMGTLIGFKALVAAVIGGIGSVSGAFLGGLIIAAIETFWTGYSVAAYKDISVFLLLILFLALQPAEILGKITRRP